MHFFDDWRSILLSMSEGNRQRKKDWLSRYKRNRLAVLRLKGKVQEIDNRMNTVKTSHLSGMPRGGQTKTIADYVAEKSELESRINKLDLKGREFRREILDAIDNMEEVVQAEILELLFISGLTLEAISDELGYNVRHTYRLYAKALDSIEIPVIEDSITLK